MRGSLGPGEEVGGGSCIWRVTASGYGISFGGDGNVLELGSGDGCTTV